MKEEQEQKIIPYLTPEDLNRPRVLEDLIYPDMEIDVFWTNIWDAAFYVSLAYAGFITITLEHAEGGLLLLPELHTEYSVLEWENLHISKNLKKLARSTFFSDNDFYITFNKDVTPVVKGIAKSYGEMNWFVPRYKDMLVEIQRSEALSENLTLLSVELRNGADDRLIGGEVGYTVGTIYTSLSGYFERENKNYNNMGKLQLICLALLLKQWGYGFWNLGCPGLQYKLDIGAKYLDRSLFLNKWLENRDKTPRQQLDSFVGDKIYCKHILPPSCFQRA